MTAELKNLKSELASVQTEKAKIAYQFEDFRQNAALHWPEARKRDYRWPASVTVDLSTTIYEKARKLFQEQKWEEALKNFEKIETDFPYSKWIVEAHYYACETHFQVRDYKASSDCISQMVELFPENPLTGFQLMRLAQMHEINGQMSEASEIYRIIENQFSEPILKKQSRESLSRLESP